MGCQLCWIICGHLLVPPHCCGLPMFNCASNCRAARAPRKLGQLWTTWQQLTHFIGNNYSETVWKCVEYCVSAFYAKLFLWKTKPHGGPAQPPMVKKFIHFSQSRLIKIFKNTGWHFDEIQQCPEWNLRFLAKLQCYEENIIQLSWMLLNNVLSQNLKCHIKFCWNALKYRKTISLMLWFITQHWILIKSQNKCST